ncbi:HTH-type transcriptional regulator UlaR [Jeongeupia sp. USM3]|uniref:HTH-type transcriptional regulator UlaR n=1 Tax=Jeongeupia sp. USM3 TaxID=1906741 RepID=UPI00089DD994|nr:HTH-type transcriptional regulator UlaR [Jeongeupia sp. USM3]AOY01102.1 hypothetical protein BJP62_12000 [Jeongeupia sp. USM3]
MTEIQRHNAILALLERSPLVSVHQLIDEIGMSPATARRDLNKLDAAGKLRKVRNGAERVSPAERGRWLPLELADRPNYDEKHRIAVAAATLLRASDSVVINCGSTAFLLGQELCGKPVQIITNYYPLASYLIEHGHQNLVLMGGQYDPSQGIMISLSDDQASQFGSNWMFTSGSGLTADGLFKNNLISALSEQKVVRHAGKLVVLVDSSKVGQGSGMLFARTDEIAMVITGKQADPATVAALRAKGVEVRQV